MTELGQILLADDEQTFLLSTGDLLRREGYACDCVPNAAAALERLRVQRYDVLILDVKMPGNADLELVQALPQAAPGTPVILVTGYPSQRSAIQAIQLPVTSYLVKPIEFEELQDQVKAAVQRSRLYRTVVNMRSRLHAWREEMEPLEQMLAAPESEVFSDSLESFLDLAFGHIGGALSDVKYLTASLAGRGKERAACHLLECPRLGELTAALEDAVAVLHKTKSSFKSKELGIIRKKLEDLMETPSETSAEQKYVYQ